MKSGDAIRCTAGSNPALSATKYNRKKGENMNKQINDLIKRLRNPEHFVHGETGVYYNVGGMDELCKEAADTLAALHALDPIVLTKDNLVHMEGKHVLVKRMGSNDPAEFATVKNNGDCMTDNDSPCYHELYGATWIALLYPENTL